MMSKIVISSFGPDKPYLLDLTVGFIKARDGDILDATVKVYGSWAHLFVIFNGANLSAFRDEADELVKLLGAVVRIEDAGELEKTKGVQYREDLHGFKIIGLDKPGLIRTTTNVIRVHRMSVMRFDGHRIERKTTIDGVSQTIVEFQQWYDVRVPRNIDEAAFHASLTDTLRDPFEGRVASPLWPVPRLY